MTSPPGPAPARPPVTLASLTWDWRDVYVIGYDRDQWAAARRDGHAVVYAHTLALLESAIEANYRAPLAYPAREPAAGRLAHIRAVLATRLALQASQDYTSGQGWWRSERRIRAAAGSQAGTGHIPDAEIHWPSLDTSPTAGRSGPLRPS